MFSIPVRLYGPVVGESHGKINPPEALNAATLELAPFTVTVALVGVKV
jgi:hypothetical protein